MVRFYEGMVFSVSMAVWPTEEDVSYHVLHRNKKSGREAYLKCGLDRKLKVNEHAKLILKEGNKRKVLSLPFVKEEGQLVCDLPEFLKQNKIRHKIYKRPGCNCGDRVWDAVSYEECVCKNGELWWGINWCIDWADYWLGICYNACFPVINGKKVRKLRFWSAGKNAEAVETLEWFRQSMAEQVVMSWREFGQVLDRLGLQKESTFFDITFCDGSEVEGDAVDWSE